MAEEYKDQDVEVSRAMTCVVFLALFMFSIIDVAYALVKPCSVSFGVIMLGKKTYSSKKKHVYPLSVRFYKHVRFIKIISENFNKFSIFIDI